MHGGTRACTPCARACPQVLYLVLAPYDNEQSEQMHVLTEEKALEALPLFSQLLALFRTRELFNYAEMPAPCASAVSRVALKAELLSLGWGDAEAEATLDTLHERVVEHNIHAVARYYSRVSMQQLAFLLCLDADKMEAVLCAMVSKKQVYARIDRPAGVISFAAPKTPNALLNDWAADISTLLNKLEGVCHLIHKENMVHKIGAA